MKFITLLSVSAAWVSAIAFDMTFNSTFVANFVPISLVRSSLNVGSVRWPL